MSRRALGEQGLRLIEAAAARSQEIDKQRSDRDRDRAALRARVEAASIRPTPGTSDLLGRPLSCGVCGSIGADGKLRAIDTHDLLALAPVHLREHKLKLDAPIEKKRRP